MSFPLTPLSFFQNEAILGKLGQLCFDHGVSAAEVAIFCKPSGDSVLKYKLIATQPNVVFKESDGKKRGGVMCVRICKNKMAVALRRSYFDDYRCKEVTDAIERSEQFRRIWQYIQAEPELLEKQLAEAESKETNEK
jgi:hypothetical protein